MVFASILRSWNYFCDRPNVGIFSLLSSACSPVKWRETGRSAGGWNIFPARKNPGTLAVFTAHQFPHDRHREQKSSLMHTSRTKLRGASLALLLAVLAAPANSLPVCRLVSTTESRHNQRMSCLAHF
jgi:hypothetical protein